MAVPHEVQAAIEERDVVGIDEPVGLRVTAQRVVAHAKRPPLGERAVDLLQVLAGSELELGADGARPHAAAHALDQRQRARRHQRLDLAKAEATAGPKGPAPPRSSRSWLTSSATTSGSEKGMGRRSRKVALDLPEAAAPVALVVDREAGLLEHAEVAPHRPHGAAELAGGVLDRDSRRPAEELEQAPLTRELIPSRHRGTDSARGGRACQRERSSLLRARSR